MNPDILRQNWALAVAALLILAVATVVLGLLYRRSARGQLGATTKALRSARRQHARSQQAVRNAEQRIATLAARAASVKPRVLTEAKEALQDAQALAKISADRVLVAANHVRRVIFQEYPPARHEALRRKYLPEDKPESRPFSF